MASVCVYPPLNARFNHITGHQLEPLVEVLAKLRVRPVEVPDEGLKSIQLPEQVLRSRTAIAGEDKFESCAHQSLFFAHGCEQEVGSSVM